MDLIKVTPAANVQISKLCQENNCYAIHLTSRAEVVQALNTNGVQHK